MERKLSEKATKMRQRFLFSRSSQGRHRASTMNSSAGATSTPNSRPRSATTPVSSSSTEPAWDDSNPTGYYDFTDEPGYFRPASPLLSRQEIEEDLEDDMKHACAMLVHSIERGLPMWPSSYTNLRPNTGTGSVAKASRPETASQSQDQSTHVSSASGTLGNEISASSEMYDSGVAFSTHSSANLGKAGQNSFSGTAASASTGRFYGRRISTSPPEKATLDRGRARGQSFATDVTSIRSRSRSSSPILFPYSPPQPDAQWIQGEDEEGALTNPTSPDDLLERTGFLGAEGITWLRASLDIHRACDYESATTTSNSNSTAQPKDGAYISTISVSGPQPRRFYSTRRLPSEKIFQPQEWAYEVASSRGSSLSLCDGTPVRGLSFEEKRDIDMHDWANRNLHDHYSSRGVDNAEKMYSVGMSGDGQPRHRRKRASELLRRLVGRRRRKEGEGGERRGFEGAVVTAV